MDFNRLLQFAVEHDASDIHMQAGLRPMLRIGGILRPVEVPPITDEELHERPAG
jgi:twitching motility protein PilT